MPQQAQLCRLYAEQVSRPGPGGTKVKLVGYPALEAKARPSRQGPLPYLVRVTFATGEDYYGELSPREDAIVYKLPAADNSATDLLDTRIELGRTFTLHVGAEEGEAVTLVIKNIQRFGEERPPRLVTRRVATASAN